MVSARSIVVAVLLLGAMALDGVSARRSRSACGVLFLLGLVWIATDKPYEGTVLLTLDRDHGVTLADLIGIAAMAAAVGLWLRLWHRPGID